LNTDPDEAQTNYRENIKKYFILLNCLKTNNGFFIELHQRPKDQVSPTKKLLSEAKMKLESFAGKNKDLYYTKA
jgi:hypothetical protein